MVLTVLLIFVFAGIVYAGMRVPGRLDWRTPQEFSKALTLDFSDPTLAPGMAELRLFQLFPVKTVEVAAMEGRLVALCGTPLGLTFEVSGKAEETAAGGREGLGMMTFYDPDSLRFGGLGHPASGGKDGVMGGKAMAAEVFSVVQAAEGEPGRLRGRLLPRTLGVLEQNGENGIYGTLERAFFTTALLPVAARNQVHAGEAQMLTTLYGEEAQLYEVEILSVGGYGSEESSPIQVRMTDPRLLAETGGVVKGMSGSPILQNGRWVAVLSHLSLRNPEKGYAIFAETMLYEADSIKD